LALFLRGACIGQISYCWLWARAFTHTHTHTYCCKITVQCKWNSLL